MDFQKQFGLKVNIVFGRSLNPNNERGRERRSEGVRENSQGEREGRSERGRATMFIIHDGYE